MSRTTKAVNAPVASVWADLLEERRMEAELRARFEAE